MHLPGFGAKRAKLLYDELGVDSLEALREAAEAGEIREIRGLGREGRGEPAAGAGRARGGRRARRRASCSRARSRWPSRSRARCATIPPRDRVEIAGSLRRLGDTAKDIDIIATADDAGALISTLAELAAGRVGRRRAARRARAWSPTRA